MNAKKSGRADLTNQDPAALLRQLVKIALVSLLIILSLAASAIYGVYSRHVVSRAEAEAVRIAEALLVLERDALLTQGPGGRVRVAVDEERLPLLDRRIRGFLNPFDIIKIKVYSADAKIVYSTDRLILGRVDAGNRRLKRALAGQVDSRLEKKEEVLDLTDERKIDVDVVETYIPIRDEKGRVVGSFELYVDVTADRRDIAGGVGMSVLLLALVLLFVFASAFVLVRRGTSQLKAALEVLRTLATTDPLTSLFNRRQIFLRAEQEFARLQREREAGSPKKALGLLMLDIDHFKRHNDTYGHQVGDLILKEVADRLVRSLRRYDFVGRYGGEEFLVVLPATGFAGTQAIAERIRERVAADPVVVGDLEIPVTVSLGLACTAGEGEGFEESLKRADDGLYRAKMEGRNRVAWTEEEETAQLEGEG